MHPNLDELILVEYIKNFTFGDMEKYPNTYAIPKSHGDMHLIVNNSILEII